MVHNNIKKWMHYRECKQFHYNLSDLANQKWIQYNKVKINWGHKLLGKLSYSKEINI